MYDYVEPVNPNLVCCVCHSPFEDPVTVACQHTFCLACLDALLQTPTRLCPLDREEITQDRTRSKIVTDMVNELPVYCSNKPHGCAWTGQRQLRDTHTKECVFTIQTCPWEGCALTTVNITQHETTCEYKPSKCTHTTHGCQWSGILKDLPTHTSTCPYEAIKHFLEIYTTTQKTQTEKLEMLVDENNMLRQTLLETDAQIQAINSKLIDLMRPATNLAIIPHLTHDIGMLKNEVEIMGLNMAQSERRNAMLGVENARVREEMSDLRGVCAGLQVEVMKLGIGVRGSLNGPRTQGAASGGASTTKSTKL